MVVKIGTNALTNATGKFHRQHFEQLAQELLTLAQTRQLIIVSSGAIALGVERLGLAAKPKDIPGKQACAAVGQSRLMRAWEEALSPRVVAQVLLTHADVQERRRYLNARHTLERLISDEVIPVINENDTVSVDEIKFGDNDTLAGLVAGLVSADALVVLSDVDGLYDADPRGNPDAQLIHTVSSVTRAMLSAAGGAGTTVGTGGMVTKLRAAASVTELDSLRHCGRSMSRQSHPCFCWRANRHFVRTGKATAAMPAERGSPTLSSPVARSKLTRGHALQ